MIGMRKLYPFDVIEKKWQRKWEQEQTFRAFNPGEKIPEDHPFGKRHGLAGKVATVDNLPQKYYILDMFPYPSAAGLHVGHPEGYTATDILARYRRSQGYHVLHPMGWDAFGLPAEQYAIKTGQHPRITTERNIQNMRRQIKALGFSYDWTREISTCDPDYYKWTQWIFLKIYNAWYNPETNKAEPIETLPYPSKYTTEEEKRAWRDAHRLAYVADAPVWWCEALGTVLANEEVVDGKSEVGGYPVVRRPMRQWMLRITAYAERLLQDLDLIDWPDYLKEMQRNWIGRSEGAEIEFPVVGSDYKIKVFTTRPDTIYGATFMVLAPEHPLAEIITTSENRPALYRYKDEVARKSELERTDLAKEKTGIFTGSYAINPLSYEQIPIWVADYVLVTYGTGAIMGVPAHDERDLEFARKFNLPIKVVVHPLDDKNPIGFTGEGVSVNSGPISGLPTAKAKEEIIKLLEEKGIGSRKIQYKLRDWLFSRQRYWGEPFPIIWKKDRYGNWYHEPVPESQLPVLPPLLDEYKPTPDGQPPLARAKDWVYLPDGSMRETNTMPQWAGSCWYYLRYLDPNNKNEFVGELPERYWMGTLSAPHHTPLPGVDLYIGGAEHAVLHLLYARFWHKVLYDLGYLSTPEPFYKLVNQGLILGEDGQKMSKSRGNVINPDTILADYGADAFRMYEMFMGPLQDTKPWSTKGLEGVYRFLGRVWRMFIDEESFVAFEQNRAIEPEKVESFLEDLRLNPTIKETSPTPEQLRTIHQCIKNVTEDLEGFRFNTAISELMIFVNQVFHWDIKPWELMRDFLVLLNPFAPHLAEELWAKLHISFGKQPPSLTYYPWPKWEEKWLAVEEIEIPIQINGKVRDKIKISINATKEELQAVALEAPKIRTYLRGKTVQKVIVVPNKLINIVVG